MHFLLWVLNKRLCFAHEVNNFFAIFHQKSETHFDADIAHIFIEVILNNESFLPNSLL